MIEVLNSQDAARWIGIGREAFRLRSKRDRYFPTPVAYKGSAVFYSLADIDAYAKRCPASIRHVRMAQRRHNLPPEHLALAKTALTRLNHLVRGNPAGAWFGGVCR